MSLSSSYYKVGFILAILSQLFNIAAFAVPHWLVGWEQKWTTFDKLGLWEVCLRGFHDELWQGYKYYYGCWWIYHYEYNLIRSRLNPPWFVAVQVFAVINVVVGLIGLIAMAVKKLVQNDCTTTFGYICMIICSVCGGLEFSIFGALARNRHYYKLPDHQYNYFGAGYGCCVIATAGTIFSSMYLIASLKVKKKKD